MAITDLLGKLNRSHLACPPASETALAYGRSLGLPADVLAFYRSSNGAYLHESEGGGDFQADGRWWKWRLLPVEELRDIAATYDIDETCPMADTLRQWIALVDVLDSNYLAVDMAPERGGQIIDCFHETVGWEGYHAIIAMSFTELLLRLIERSDPYWLEDGFPKYGAH
jgi:SMI1 / KNR4 family (SUKH-1)